MAANPAKVEAFTNPTLAGFLLAEVNEHIARTEAEANGSHLVAPRMTLLRQFVNQVQKAHGWDTPQEPAKPGGWQ